MSDAVPYPRSYWVAAGRVLAGCFPGDKLASATEAKLEALLDCGVTHFVNLMEAQEVNHAGEPFLPYAPVVERLAAARGRAVRCQRFAMVDRSTPTVSLMREILDALDGAEARGDVSYVHCWGGRGRTGTVVACHLRRRHRFTAAAALARVQELTRGKRHLFHPTPEVGIQRDFVAKWDEWP